ASEDLRREVLGGRLAGRARDGREPEAYALLDGGGELLQRLDRPGDEDRRETGRQVRRPALAEEGQRAAPGRFRREVVAVGALAADRDEEIARLDVPRVDRHAGQDGDAFGLP